MCMWDVCMDVCYQDLCFLFMLITETQKNENENINRTLTRMLKPKKNKDDIQSILNILNDETHLKHEEYFKIIENIKKYNPKNSITRCIQIALGKKQIHTLYGNSRISDHCYNITLGIINEIKNIINDFIDPKSLDNLKSLNENILKSLIDNWVDSLEVEILPNKIKNISSKEKKYLQEKNINFDKSREELSEEAVKEIMNFRKNDLKDLFVFNEKYFNKDSIKNKIFFVVTKDIKNEKEKKILKNESIENLYNMIDNDKDFNILKSLIVDDIIRLNIIYPQLKKIFRRFIWMDHKYDYFKNYISMILDNTIKNLANSFIAFYDKKRINSKWPRFKKKDIKNSFGFDNNTDKVLIKDNSIKYSDPIGNKNNIEYANKEFRLLGRNHLLKNKDIIFIKQTCESNNIKNGNKWYNKTAYKIIRPFRNYENNCVIAGIDRNCGNICVYFKFNDNTKNYYKFYEYDEKQSKRILFLENKIKEEKKSLQRKRDARKKLIESGEIDKYHPVSNNYLKNRDRIRVLFNKIKNIKMDHLHKISSDITKIADIVILEDLKINNMKKSASKTKEELEELGIDSSVNRGVSAKRGLNRSISSQCWGILARLLEYKCKEFILVPPPNTSRKCSECGHCESGNRLRSSNKKNDIFKCLKCGYEVHADINASKNICFDGINLINDKSKFLSVVNQMVVLNNEVCGDSEELLKQKTFWKPHTKY